MEPRWPWCTQFLWWVRGGGLTESPGTPAPGMPHQATADNPQQSSGAQCTDERCHHQPSQRPLPLSQSALQPPRWSPSRGTQALAPTLSCCKKSLEPAMGQLKKKIDKFRSYGKMLLESGFMKLEGKKESAKELLEKNG